jgi:hypothetical protein
MQRNFQNARLQPWNLTLEHQFTQNWSARASYVGGKTEHVEWNETDYDIPKIQTPNETTQQERPFQPWSTIYATRSGADQNLEQ